MKCKFNIICVFRFAAKFTTGNTNTYTQKILKYYVHFPLAYNNNNVLYVLFATRRKKANLISFVDASR